MRKEIEMWLAQATEDLEAASANLKMDIYYAAGFFAQQCAEKALKAVCLKKLNTLIKVHDLVFLARKAGAPKELHESCRFLTRAYIESRYPSDVEIPSKIFSKEEANKCIEIAKEVLVWAKKQF